jgi:predicted dehydrogenase
MTNTLAKLEWAGHVHIRPDWDDARRKLVSISPSGRAAREAAIGYRPMASREGVDRRVKSMMVAFRYDNGAVGSLYYSREIPSLLRGLRVSKLFGREGVISFESNGGAVLVRGKGLPRLVFPGIRDIRGYQAMYRDIVRAIRDGVAPEMSLERAMEDQRLMDQVYASAGV